MTRYDAYIDPTWETHGLAHLLVARLRADGSGDFGIFLVDTLCLGVKDAILEEDVPASAVADFIAENFPGRTPERLHPACAKKLIEGAVAYAERFGFAPARDFRKARRVLTGLDSTLCPRDFTFGRDGKPFYVQGPDDTPERVDRVLAFLEARCGIDGFDYQLVQSDDDIEADRADARGALMMFFDDLDDDAPNFYEFAGLVTALHLCPTLVPPSQLLARLFGPAGHTWQDADEAKDFADDLGVYWNYTADLVAACLLPPSDDTPSDPIDVYAGDFGDPDDEATLIPMGGAFIAWCGGFIRATHEWPEAWDDALTRPDLAPHWAFIRAFADPSQPEHVALLKGDSAPASQFGPSGRLSHSVMALVRALRPLPPPTA